MTSFLQSCLTCGWCCQGENIFLSADERKRLGINRVKRTEDGSCQFYKNNRCSIYRSRPIECHIFPLDIVEIKGKPNWVLWEHCREAKVPSESRLKRMEREIPDKYVEAYVRYHKTHQPSKYGKTDRHAKVLRMFIGRVHVPNR